MLDEIQNQLESLSNSEDGLFLQRFFKTGRGEYGEDIVKTMRNPGPGMNKFDQTTIPDEDATAIAEYVLLTYK